ncbi:MAG: hypothetical protein ACOCX2_11265 [Armatimonadota bacterium]
MVHRLHFPKLSKFDRVAEPVTFAVPFPAGELLVDQSAAVSLGVDAFPTQSRPTALWPDGSVKWLLVDALVDLPGNDVADYELTPGAHSPASDVKASAEIAEDRPRIETGPLRLSLSAPGESGLLHEIALDGATIASGGELIGPQITIGGETFEAEVGADGWQVAEAGPVRVVLECEGIHRAQDGGEAVDFIARVTAWAGKPWFELRYRVINREAAESTVIEAMRWAACPEVEAEAAGS